MNYNLHIVDYLRFAMGTQRMKQRRVHRNIHKKIMALHERWLKECELLDNTRQM